MGRIDQAVRRLEQAVERLERSLGRRVELPQQQAAARPDHAELTEAARGMAARLDAAINRIDRVLEG